MSLCIRPGEVQQTPGLQQTEPGGLNTEGLMDENLLAPGRGADAVSRAAKKAGYVGTKRLTIIRQHYQPGGTHLPHEHDRGEQVYYLESGHARVRLADETFDIEPGTVVYIPPKTDHEFVTIGDDPCVNILISVGLEEADVASLASGVGSPCIHPGDVTPKPGIERKKDGSPNTTELMDENLLRRGGDGEGVGYAGTKRVSMIRQHYGPGGKHYPHEHESSEQAYYLVSGTARVRVADEHFEMTQGTVVYLPPQVEHEFENAGDGECVNILIGVQLDSGDIA